MPEISKFSQTRNTKQLQDLRRELGMALCNPIEHLGQTQALGRIEEVIKELATYSEDHDERKKLQNFIPFFQDIKAKAPLAANALEDIPSIETEFKKLGTTLDEDKVKLAGLEQQMKALRERSDQIEQEITKLEQERLKTLALHEDIYRSLFQSIEDCVQHKNQWEALHQAIFSGQTKQMHATVILAQANASWSVLKAKLNM
ncbi:Disease resistance protein [Quillaja saponaria]|nr:Disease resistance protein [Quillaja saponaria]